MKYNGDRTLNEIVETVETLVSFKTTPSNFTEFERAVYYIENYFNEVPVKIAKHYFNNFPALFISTTGLKHAEILLQAHVDVVNGNDEQFIPRIKNGKMYGRGTSDMKGFVAVAMKIIKDFALRGGENNIALILTFDEEIGSENGAKKMAELGYTGNLIINGDAGYNYAVIYGEKGILKITLEVEASPGRHPYTWEGKNAFELLNEDYNSVIDLFKDKEIATEDDNWHTTYSIYDIEFKNREQYPPHFGKAKMNFYFTENLTVEEIFELIKSKIRHCKIEKFIGSERVYINPESKHVKLLQEIMSNHFGRQIDVRTENGSSDARFYANAGVPIVVLKPVGEDHHGDNEFLVLDLLLPLYYTLKEFILVTLENIKEQSFVEVSNGK